MAKRFGDWVVGRVAEAATGSPAVEVDGEFDKARQEIESLIDSAFRTIADRLHRSFSDPGKVDRNTRENMAQALVGIARRLRSAGTVPQAQRSVGVTQADLDPAVKEHIGAVLRVVAEAEAAGDSPQFSVKSVSDYLGQMRDRVMAGVDRILAAAKRDVVQQGMSSLGGKVDALHQRLDAPPLTGAEREEAIASLADLGRAGVMNRQTGLAKAPSDIKVYPSPDNLRGYVTFDPTDPQSIEQALGRVANPRRVLVGVGGGKPLPVDLTNRQSVARVMTYLHQRHPVAPPATTGTDDPLKTARLPRKQVIPRNDQ
jgi:hypothetical protein